MTMQVIETNQQTEWTAAVEHCLRHDFYHLPQYHAMADEAHEGKAVLFYYSEDAYSIALPLLIRPIDALPNGAPHMDATSVYGYAGPIASHEEIPFDVIQRFHESLRNQLQELGVISVFTRLHPIIPQKALLAGLGECRTLSRTVSIDLTLTAEEQRAAMRSSVKLAINRLRRKGMECVHDREGLYLNAFAEIYRETMLRVGAAPGYFYTEDYFRGLSANLGEKHHLFVCLLDGKPVCAGVFIECLEILQYHLGGTLSLALVHGPMKLLFDEVRIWANSRNLKFFHLGGGATTDPNDPLLYFKLGFSKMTHDFNVWCWVLNESVYKQLCEEASRFNQVNGLVPAKQAYFPEYRSPTVHSKLALEIG